ncbi:MAG: hypothetical protein WBG41_00975, partial [Acidimicrobiales bacterium]
GAIWGERAGLEAGRRNSTLVAVTPCRVAVVPHEVLDKDQLRELAKGHGGGAGSPLWPGRGAWKRRPAALVRALTGADGVKRLSTVRIASLAGLACRHAAGGVDSGPEAPTPAEQ